ncbi:DUF4128 domain-containing protein [Pseudomonas sp. 21LCFQ02]|uniref:phage tail terminator-like protein n=1 Tax=Pseudomonas sp. 21LCFQ02 TaxID=2957505 RepID=UPI00209AA9F8|nr:phage tail terminator-like protein [Pseudomonas sp. 21LCFQ02]MCO8166834.1 DUF4128 domain-containing protein [Pseudomonas sp. 21LCFQ02]
MTFEQIRLAIVDRMNAFQGIAQDRIEYPNPDEIFQKPSEGVWCRLSIQGGTAFFAGVGDKPHARRPGQAVIQCFDRKGVGTGAVTRLADALSDHFQFWRQGDLECWEASMHGAGESGGFIQFNVVIRYVAG